jgi:hypothetical protein
MFVDNETRRCGTIHKGLEHCCVGTGKTLLDFLYSVVKPVLVASILTPLSLENREMCFGMLISQF